MVDLKSGRAGGMGEILDVEGPYEVAPLGTALVELSANRPEIVGLTADMGRFSDIHAFRDAHPDRFFNVGMAEADLLLIAAGLAKTGKIAYCTTYSVFVTRRALDFLVIACAHSKANVKILAGMSGLMNPYGATHQATDDIAVLRMIPDLAIIDPCDATELAQVVKAVADIEGTVYVRSLRGKVPVVFDPEEYSFEFGKAKELRSGSDVGVISTGFMTQRAFVASAAARERGLGAGVLHVPTIKPFDTEAVLRFAAGVDRLVIAENHQMSGGLATLVTEALYDAGLHVPMIKIGIQHRFHECGSQAYMEEKYGLDQGRITRAVIDGV
ncbi:transketolase family protein [Herbiconiux ginsengi]|uniref:Transketolase n=1 Tax=Herbiconiux ginsengi TaxID=381665 RepID=A0A1H3NCU2_9MICO|nr:transketolase C-terminal domain-containing protein [Herbiconiux ginsengi]SDY86737.1 transketolase [Herbiconiux ginsengi]